MLPEGWIKKPLSACAKFMSGGTPSKGNAAYWGGEFPWITAKDMKTLWLRKAGLGLTDQGRSVTKVVPSGSILILTRGMTLLKDFPVCLAGRELAFNQDIKALLPHGDVDSTFLAYQLIANKQNVLNLVDTAGHGTGRLDTELLKGLQIDLPPLPEQRRIAAGLATWDEAIATTELLVANSRHQSQVLLSNVLTGRRRLERFRSELAQIPTPHGPIPGDWTYPRVESFAHEVSQRHSGGQNYPVLSCTKHAGLVDSLSYFKKQVFSKDLSTYKVVPRGCFVYATNHIEEGSIGYQGLHDSGLVSPMYTVFETGNEVHDGYLYRLLKTEHFRQIFAAATNASVDRRGSLRWNDFKKLHVPLPPMEEQLAIAELLDKADRETGLLEARLAAFHVEKTALMQQLLTGKRRVHLPEAAEATTA